MRGLRTIVLENIFKVQTVNGVFSDAIHEYAANAAAVAATCVRVGQILAGESSGTYKAYIGISAGDTADTGWVELPNT